MKICDHCGEQQGWILGDHLCRICKADKIRHRGRRWTRQYMHYLPKEVWAAARSHKRSWWSR